LAPLLIGVFGRNDQTGAATLRVGSGERCALLVRSCVVTSTRKATGLTLLPGYAHADGRWPERGTDRIAPANRGCRS
jgi:hypothetical protein